MKRIEPVMITGSTGQVQADTYDRWTKNIAGLRFEFALHADASDGQPLLRDLRVSELSTGFDTGTSVNHPVHKVQLTEAALSTLPPRQIKKAARAALHRHLNRVGYGNFVKAVLQGQIQAAKLGEHSRISELSVEGTTVSYGMHKEDRDAATTAMLRALKSDS